ncbi:MAG: acetyl-CoA carboxylase [Shinella sp.]|nr:acetyl-CoA carboxylase [Shinella sp.]
MSATGMERLEALMTAYGIAALDFEEGDLRINLRRSPAKTNVPGHSLLRQKTVLASPSFGSLLLRHPASATDAPALPRKANKGDIVAYLAIGPLLRPVIAERDCVLRRILVPEGAMVGFGEPLFEL